MPAQRDGRNQKQMLKKLSAAAKALCKRGWSKLVQGNQAFCRDWIVYEKPLHREMNPPLDPSSKLPFILRKLIFVEVERDFNAFLL